MNPIDIRHIAFSYPRKPLFDDLSLCFQKSEFCALIGPNGSGKTTLLKCIAGLLPVLRGDILLNNRPLNSYTISGLAKTISYVPQHQDVIFDISVHDLVLTGRNPYQKRWQIASSDDNAIVDDMLEKCHLITLKDRMLSQLSGGELQRALIARAMAQQTPVMLLDEPLSNLDVSHKFEIMDILRQLNIHRQVLIILIIHDFSIALEYARQAILMKDGKIILHGDISAVLSPENIRNCFELGPEFRIERGGHISKI